MKIWVDKELFQWEKNRWVNVETSENESEITYVQFYNKKASYGPEIPLENNKAKIPDYLLKESLPIMAVACIGSLGETQVIGRREFKVIKRVKPENYVENPSDPDDPNGSNKDVIYDGGVEV